MHFSVIRPTVSLTNLTNKQKISQKLCLATCTVNGMEGMGEQMQRKQIHFGHMKLESEE